MKISEPIKKEDLVYFGYRAEPYFASHIILTGMLNQDAFLEVFHCKNKVKWIQVNYSFFQNKDDLEKLETELYQHFEVEGVKYAQLIVEKCLSYGNELISISKNIGDKEFSTNEKDFLVKKLKEYASVVQKYTVFYSMAMFEGPVMKLAESVVEKNAGDINEKENLFDLITTSIRDTAVECEQEDFLKIACQKDIDYEKLAYAHAKKYGWLSFRFFLGEPWTTEDVLKRLETTNLGYAKSELLKRVEGKKERNNKINQAISLFTQEDKEKVLLIREIVFLRNQRADFLNESAYYIRPLLEKIAEVLQIRYENMMNLSFQEIVDSLKDNFNYKVHIENRKKNFIVYFKDTSPIILEAIEAEDFLSEHDFLVMKSDDVKELKGKVGFKGTVKGKVKIVLNNNDIAKVENGDILVTPMTIPNFIPAMERASAFVTDEGGITCHAAIVAREMKKPCIIGTKIATKVLKDGDMVEVDAEKGIVKILKKADEKRR